MNIEYGTPTERFLRTPTRRMIRRGLSGFGRLMRRLCGLPGSLRMMRGKRRKRPRSTSGWSRLTGFTGTSAQGRIHRSGSRRCRIRCATIWIRPWKPGKLFFCTLWTTFISPGLSGSWWIDSFRSWRTGTTSFRSFPRIFWITPHTISSTIPLLTTACFR